MLIVLGPLLVVAAFVMFDFIVRTEYSHYRAQWLVDGSPHGFFWMPDEAKGALHAFPAIRSTWAFSVCSGRWLFSTPDWVRENSAARNALLAYRLCCSALVLVIGWLLL